MRIKHTPTERYKVYNFFPCNSESFKRIKRWYYYKSYSTKQVALNAIKSAKEKEIEKVGKNNLVWKIVWCPSPYASEEYCIVVYNEDQEN